MLEWLRAQIDLAPRQRPGVRAFIQRVERAHAKAGRAATEVIERKLPGVLEALSAQLDEYWLRCSVSEGAAPPSMRDVTGEALVDLAGRLANAARRVESIDDAGALHRARIAAKRLRYLLETLPDVPGAPVLIERLTALQDGLGLAHDRHLMVERIVRELGELGARDARRRMLHQLGFHADEAPRPLLTRLRPGLAILAERAHQEERAAYEAFVATWDEAALDELLRAVRSVGAG
jgi:CHAD domain-containing protein